MQSDQHHREAAEREAGPRREAMKEHWSNEADVRMERESVRDTRPHKHY